MKSQYIFIRHTKIHKYQQFKDFSKLCTFKIYMINNISITNQVSSAHSFNSCVVRSLVILFLIFKLYLIIYLMPLLTIIQLYHGCQFYYPPAPRRGRGVYCFSSVRPSKIFFVAFFSVTVDGRNLIFGHKHHIGIPYCG